MNRRIFLTVALFLATFPSVAVDIAVSHGPVVPGVWNDDLPAVLEMARKEHRPVLLVHTSQGCPLCARLNQAIDGEAFSQWQNKRKLLMAYVRTSGLGTFYKQTRNLIKSIAGELPGFPTVCVYWPKADGTTNCVAFAGRRGEMGAERNPLFSVEFMMAVDLALKDYLAQDPDHVTVEQIVKSSTKTISFAKTGTEGSVIMRPASGIFSEGEKVILEARAGTNSIFMGWFDPGGNAVEWNYRLVVSGRMPAGAYTAKFRAKTGCPPPVLPIASTSLCVRVGQKFDYSVPVDESCRPVRFRAVQRLPKGLVLDKVSGQLTGSLRKEGNVRMTIAVIGSDEASTAKNYSIDLRVLPKKVDP